MEGSNETIVRGEMVDTPPGWVATAYCPKDVAEWRGNLGEPVFSLTSSPFGEQIQAEFACSGFFTSDCCDYYNV